jgi:hypothetical protein
MLVDLLGEPGAGKAGEVFPLIASLGGVVSISCFDLDPVFRSTMIYLLTRRLKSQSQVVFSRPNLQIFGLHPRLCVGLAGIEPKIASDVWNLFDRCLLVSACVDAGLRPRRVSWSDSFVETDSGVFQFSSLRSSTNVLGQPSAKLGRPDGVICYQHERPFVGGPALVPPWGRSRYVNSIVREVKGPR